MINEVIPLKAAKRIRAARIATLEAGSDDDRELARLLGDCRKNERCHSTECAVCGHFRMKKLRRVARRMETTTSSGFTMHVPIDRITVKMNGRRLLDKTQVRVIAASMAEVGQIVPITICAVREKTVLVSGLHRLEAAKSLGWKHIYADAIVKSGDDARKDQLYENVARVDLRVLDKAEHVVELRALLITEAEVAQVEQPGGAQPAEQYLKKTAKRLGLSRDAVRRFLLIAGLTATAKLCARQLLLDDNQQVLLLAAQGADEIEQVRVLNDAARRAAVKRGVAKEALNDSAPPRLTKLAAQAASDADEIADCQRRRDHASARRRENTSMIVVKRPPNWGPFV